MLILGVNYSSHDAAVALIKDGSVIFACEEERLNREKHTKKFPINAIKVLLEYTQTSFEDIDYIAFFVDPKLHYRLIIYNLIQAFPKSILYIPYGIKIFKKRYRMKEIFIQHFYDLKLPQIVYVNHHIAHAASAFHLSPFERSAILTIDGRGEYETTMISHGVRTNIKMTLTIKYPHSLGYLYSMVTKYLGFKPQHDEYKVMALSALGTPKYYNDFLDLIIIDDKSGFRLNLEYFDHHYRYGKNRKLFSEKFIRKFGPPRLPNENITQRHKDIAFALQKVTEEVVLHLVKLAKDLTGEENLCMAGGVALNSVVNAKIIDSKIFKKIFIQPVANDAGTSVGAALYTYYQKSKNFHRTQTLRNVFWGPSFSDEDIKVAIERYRHHVKTEELQNPEKKACSLIHKGLVVGWFQGKMEFGPRALGNRSIIASPTDSRMRDIINKKIKFREEFRPFAASILSEYVNEFFEYNPIGELLYPYMLATVKAKREVYNKIPAVLHHDKTSRIQIVDRNNNPIFWNLINEYYKISGIPMVLNTSFNTKGEPIVCTPDNAIRTLLKSNLDCVILGKFLVRRR